MRIRDQVSNVSVSGRYRSAGCSAAMIVTSSARCRPSKRRRDASPVGDPRRTQDLLQIAPEETVKGRRQSRIVSLKRWDTTKEPCALKL